MIAQFVAGIRLDTNGIVVSIHKGFVGNEGSVVDSSEMPTCLPESLRHSATSHQAPHALRSGLAVPLGLGMLRRFPIWQ